MFHDVYFLHVSIELDGLTTLGFVSGAGFILFVWPLRNVPLGVFLEYFTILRGVSGAMQQACVSCTGHIITLRD